MGMETQGVRECGSGHERGQGRGQRHGNGEGCSDTMGIAHEVLLEMPESCWRVRGRQAQEQQRRPGQEQKRRLDLVAEL